MNRCEDLLVDEFMLHILFLVPFASERASLPVFVQFDKSVKL